MKLTKRDYDGAREKLAKAGFTERQLEALEDIILTDAVRRAEELACIEEGRVAYRLVGLRSLLSWAGTPAGFNALRVAVYWFHELKNQRQRLIDSETHTAYPISRSWTPGGES